LDEFLNENGKKVVYDDLLDGFTDVDAAPELYKAEIKTPWRVAVAGFEK
jgi:hypothetical protein